MAQLNQENQKEINKKDKTIQDLQSQITDFKSTINSLSIENGELINRNKSLERQSNLITEEKNNIIKELELEKAEVSQKNIVIETQLSELKSELQIKNDDYAKLESEKQKLSQELNAKEILQKEFTQKLEDAASQSYKLAQLNQENQKEINKKDKTIQDLQSQITDFESTINSLSIENDELINRNKSLERQSDLITEEKNNIIKELELEKAKVSQKNIVIETQLSELKSELQIKNDDYAKLESEREKLSQELSAKVVEENSTRMLLEEFTKKLQYTDSKLCLFERLDQENQKEINKKDEINQDLKSRITDLSNKSDLEKQKYTEQLNYRDSTIQGLRIENEEYINEIKSLERKNNLYIESNKKLEQELKSSKMNYKYEENACDTEMPHNKLLTEEIAISTIKKNKQDIDTISDLKKLLSQKDDEILKLNETIAKHQKTEENTFKLGINHALIPIDNGYNLVNVEQPQNKSIYSKLVEIIWYSCCGIVAGPIHAFKSLLHQENTLNYTIENTYEPQSIDDYVITGQVDSNID